MGCTTVPGHATAHPICQSYSKQPMNGRDQAMEINDKFGSIFLEERDAANIVCMYVCMYIYIYIYDENMWWMYSRIYGLSWITIIELWITSFEWHDSPMIFHINGESHQVIHGKPRACCILFALIWSKTRGTWYFTLSFSFEGSIRIIYCDIKQTRIAFCIEAHRKIFKGLQIIR